MSPVWAWLVPAFGLPGFYPSLVCMGPALPGLAHARADLAPAWSCLLALVPAWLVLPGSYLGLASCWVWLILGLVLYLFCSGLPLLGLIPCLTWFDLPWLLCGIDSCLVWTLLCMAWLGIGPALGWNMPVPSCYLSWLGFGS